MHTLADRVLGTDGSWWAYYSKDDVRKIVDA